MCACVQLLVGHSSYTSVRTTCLMGGILHMVKTTPQILLMFMDAANWRERERHSDTVQVTVSFSAFCLSPHIQVIHIMLWIRGGSPASARVVWGGGDSV